MSDRSGDTPGGGVPFQDPTPIDAFVLQEFAPRERDVLTPSRCGNCNKRNARELAVTVSTVKTHVHAIMNQLESRACTDAVLKAHRLGLVRL